MHWCNVGHRAAAELIQDAGAAKVALIASANSVIPSSEVFPPSSLSSTSSSRSLQRPPHFIY